MVFCGGAGEGGWLSMQNAKRKGGGLFEARMSKLKGGGGLSVEGKMVFIRWVGTLPV